MCVCVLQNIPALPCGKALYSYEGKEPGDLQFSKGDIIILRRKVDDNWYHGELNGCHGFLPASYIQLLRPLSQTPPQGKALYDFEVKDKDQDKDCLAFSKVTQTHTQTDTRCTNVHLRTMFKSYWRSTSEYKTVKRVVGGLYLQLLEYQSRGKHLSVVLNQAGSLEDSNNLSPLAADHKSQQPKSGWLSTCEHTQSLHKGAAVSTFNQSWEHDRQVQVTSQSGGLTFKSPARPTSSLTDIWHFALINNKLPTWLAKWEMPWVAHRIQIHRGDQLLWGISSINKQKDILLSPAHGFISAKTTQTLVTRHLGQFRERLSYVSIVEKTWSTTNSLYVATCCSCYTLSILKQQSAGLTLWYSWFGRFPIWQWPFSIKSIH